MDMDDSAGGGRLAFYIDRATAYNLNFAGGRIIDGSGDGARAASDFNGLTLEISLTGAVETSRTVPVQENAVVMFDSLPVGGTVRIKAKVWRQSAKFGTIICCEGISEPITIQQGENSHVFPLSMLSSVLPLTLEAAAAGTITITNPWTTLKYTINGGALTAVPSDGRLLRIRQRDEPGHAERG